MIKFPYSIIIFLCITFTLSESRMYHSTLFEVVHGKLNFFWEIAEHRIYDKMEKFVNASMHFTTPTEWYFTAETWNEDASNMIFPFSVLCESPYKGSPPGLANLYFQFPLKLH